MSTERRVFATLAVVFAVGAACTIGEPPESPDTGEASPPSTVASLPSITLPGATTATAPAALDASFAQLSDALSGDIALAYVPVGAAGPAVTLGDPATGPAWSTIKVPLAIAAYRHEGAAADTAARAAITASDNDAAEQLWESLGDPATAAAAVQTVLGDAGDTTTRVESQHVRAGFSAFGQTVWSLADQARFGARLPCLPDSAPVVTLMGEVVPDQQWGLARVADAAYKAGWGPDAVTGGYLVRQFGLVPTPGGQVAVAIAAVPDSGSFSDGTAMLNQIGVWLAEHIAEIPGGSCS